MPDRQRRLCGPPGPPARVVVARDREETDGTRRTITLRGVGCAYGLCSRVRAMDTDGESVWLDSLASLRDISSDTNGHVTAILQSRKGEERRASIVAGNRVLYLRGPDERTEKLDLASVIRLDFE
jgi:hypothetical protein